MDTTGGAFSADGRGCATHVLHHQQGHRPPVAGGPLERAVVDHPITSDMAVGPAAWAVRHPQFALLHPRLSLHQPLGHGKALSRSEADGHHLQLRMNRHADRGAAGQMRDL